MWWWWMCFLFFLCVNGLLAGQLETGSFLLHLDDLGHSLIIRYVASVMIITLMYHDPVQELFPIMPGFLMQTHYKLFPSTTELRQQYFTQKHLCTFLPSLHQAYYSQCSWPSCVCMRLGPSTTPCSNTCSGPPCSSSRETH